MPFTPAPPRRRPPATRPLADLVGGSMGPALARHGFGAADVLLHWGEIVGPELAGACQPLRMQWRPRRTGPDAAAEPATLVVRVESASALRLQHMEQVVVERLNAYLGWRCVGRLALRQGPLPDRAPARVGSAPPPPHLLAAAQRETAGVEDESLRAALARLGARAMQRRGLR